MRDEKPKLFLLLAEDPFYTPAYVRHLLQTFPGQITGAAFASGFLSYKRIWRTLLIYGLWEFFRHGVIVTVTNLTGGRTHNLLKEHNVPIYEILSSSDPNLATILKNQAPQLIVSNNWPYRLKQNVLEIPSIAAINLHLGKLPAYRGVFPIFHALLRGEKEFGVTVHHMNESFDDGLIINQEAISIDAHDTLFSLYPKAFDFGTRLIGNAIEEISADNTTTAPNGPEGQSYFSYQTIAEIARYKRIMFRRWLRRI